MPKPKRTSRKTDEAATTPAAPAETAAAEETSEAAEAVSSAKEAVLSAREVALEARLAKLDAQEAELAKREAAIETKAKSALGAIEAAKAKPGITTSNMPNAEGDSLIVMPPSNAPKDAPPTRTYQGKELGKCVHRVTSRKAVPARAEFTLTFDISKVYRLVLLNGEAKVPDVIANFIREKNPGNALRVS